MKLVFFIFITFLFTVLLKGFYDRLILWNINMANSNQREEEISTILKSTKPSL